MYSDTARVRFCSSDGEHILPALYSNVAYSSPNVIICTASTLGEVSTSKVEELIDRRLIARDSYSMESDSGDAGVSCPLVIKCAASAAAETKSQSFEFCNRYENIGSIFTARIRYLMYHRNLRRGVLVGCVILCLLGVSRGSGRNLTAATEAFQKINELIYENFQDELPSCDKGIYVGTDHAKKSASCLDIARAGCPITCTEKLQAIGIDCTKEETILEAKLQTKWGQDFSKNGTLPSGVEAKIFEEIVILGLQLSGVSVPQPGFLSTEKGRAETLEKTQILQAVVNKTLTGFGKTTLEQDIATIDKCFKEASAASTSSSLLSNHLAISLLYCIAVITNIL